MPEFTSLRGVHWNYTVEGDGPTIVFIHGFGGSLNWWHNQKDFFKRDFQVVAMDLPGHGKTSFKPLNPVDMAHDLKLLMGSLSTGPISVVGSSLGGLIALELYRIMPQEIMRMSLVGSIPRFARTVDYPAGLDIAKIRRLSQQFEGDRASILDIFFRSLFTMHERDSAAFKALKALRAQDTVPSKEVLQHFLNILEHHDLRDRLATLVCPLQCITGAEDYICPAPLMEWMAQHIPNARFDTMAHCGHLPFLTEIAAYNRLLEDFLLN